MDNKEVKDQEVRGTQGQAAAGGSNARGSADIELSNEYGRMAGERSRELGTTPTGRPYTGDLLANNGNFGDMFWSGGKRAGTSDPQTGAPSGFSDDNKDGSGKQHGKKERGSHSHDDDDEGKTGGGKRDGQKKRGSDDHDNIEGKTGGGKKTKH